MSDALTLPSSYVTIYLSLNDTLLWSIWHWYYSAILLSMIFLVFSKSNFYHLQLWLEAMANYGSASRIKPSERLYGWAFMETFGFDLKISLAKTNETTEGKTSLENSTTKETFLVQRKKNIKLAWKRFMTRFKITNVFE